MSNKLVNFRNGEALQQPKTKKLVIEMPAPKQAVVTIVAIALLENGEVDVVGPIGNPALFKQIIMKAWDGVVKHHTQPAPSPIHLPPGLVVPQ